MRSSLFAGGLVLWISIGAGRALGGTPAENAAEIGHRLESLVDEGFRGQVLLERDGDVLLDQAYGMADEETSTPASADTLYYIGSTAKMFTSAVVLQLAGEGKLGLDDTIDRYLQEVPPEKAGITIRQLLSHTSGAVRRHPDPMVKLDRDGFLKWFLATPLEHEPGTKWSYSNAGYSLLAVIVETAGGEAFGDAVRHRVFKPAGMKDTFVLDDPELPRKRLARGTGPLVAKYQLDGDPLAYGGTWMRMGAGGIVTTARDLLRWEMALREEEVLKSEQYEEATRPAPGAEDYGLGWRLSKTTRGTPLHFHDGSLPGFNAGFARFPEERATVIILCNRDEAAQSVVQWVIADFFRE